MTPSAQGGEPAYPSPYQYGFSKREALAKAFMQAILTAGAGANMAERAEGAVSAADALIAELAKAQP